MSARQSSLRRWLAFAICYLALHAVASWRWPWESTSLAAAWLSISPDLVALLGAGWLLVLWRGERRLAAHLVVIGTLCVPLYRFGATVMPVFFEKEFEPQNDILLVPALVDIVTHRLVAWQQVLLIVLAPAAAVLLYVLLYRATRLVLRAAADPRRGYALLAVCQALVVASWVDDSLRAQPASRVFTPSMLGRALTDAVQIVAPAHGSLDELVAARTAAAQAEIATTPHDLALLRGADVYLVFIESYGACILRSHARAPFEIAARSLEASLGEHGFAACSALAFPSIHGGLSSLAHAELLCGVAIENRRVFDAVLHGPLRALPRFFDAAGYRTLNVQPAMPRAWPEGKFFGFQEDVFQDALPYAGPEYHWGRMPDQLALQHVLATRIARAQQPIFLQYVSVVSHAPFRMIPPYYDDWSEVASAGFAPARTYDIGWTNYMGHPQVEEAYLEAIQYTLRTVVGFAAQLTRPSLLIVLGDHQPPAVGELAAADPSFDVPLHAIANRDDLLQPLRALGFTPGLVPSGAPFSTARFLCLFLRAFSQGEPRPKGH